MTSYAFQKKVRMTFVMMLILLAVSAFAFPVELNAAEVVSEVKGGDYTTALVCFAAALAFACGACGAGMAISKVGSAAMGAISERPEIATNALIFIALAEGLVVFGFITALMILGKV